MIQPPLAAACQAVGLDQTEARLLHARANHTYHLPRELVVVRLRRTRNSEEWIRRLTTAVQVTAWLAARGFPTVEPWPAASPAVTIDGWTATFWRYVPTETALAPANSTDLAELLRDLHSQPEPPVQLASTNPLGALLADLDHAGEALTQAQHSWLKARATTLNEQYPHTPMPLGHGMIHGDAHTGNLFPTSRRYLLGDWDSVSYGPRAQDLVPTLDGVHHFGQPQSDWDRLCTVYGVETGIENHPGMRLLCAARELRSLAAYIRSAPGRPDIHSELTKRLQTLMDGTPARWQPI
ncbi:phosphotransferase [Spirillospora sp. CA-128828]|uniref:phosphotransferase n=1 Tax=Spirillospora sp. CA-128828 TaxID=3240033 RepID=UPI003D8D7B65